MGHNAKPVNDGRCCGTCNALRVIPARMKAMFEKPAQKVDSKSFIVVVGDVVEGFSFFGPFDDEDSAIDFDQTREITGVVVQLRKPITDPN